MAVPPHIGNERQYGLQDGVLSGSSSMSSTSGAKERTTGFGLSREQGYFLCLADLISASIGQKQGSLHADEEFFVVEWQTSGVEKHQASPTTTSAPWQLSLATPAKAIPRRWKISRRTAGSNLVALRTCAAALEAMQGRVGNGMAELTTVTGSPRAFDRADRCHRLASSVAKACLRTASLEDPSLVEGFLVRKKHSVLLKGQNKQAADCRLACPLEPR